MCACMNLHSRAPDSSALCVKWQSVIRCKKRQREKGMDGERGEGRRGEAKDRMKSLLKNLSVCVCVWKKKKEGVAMARH